jgi:tRNA1Val (adenine37-N6)-methyltransferase
MSIFKFLAFNVKQSDAAMKIGTDAMVFGALIDSAGKVQALDIGTGTGVLSLMVAQQNRDLQIQAIEIAPEAAQEAQENFHQSPFHEQLTIVPADFTNHIFHQAFDLIFSNPPYFEKSSKSGNEQRNLARHDDGLPLETLFQRVAELLAPKGSFWLILPAATMDAYLEFALDRQLYLRREISIFGKPGNLVRKVCEFQKETGETAFDSLIVRTETGEYTDAYVELTKAYHFNQLR